MIVLMAECCDECKDDPCAPCDGCVDSVDNFLFSSITRFWNGPDALFNGVPVTQGDRIDTTTYTVNVAQGGAGVFTTMQVTNYLGLEEDDPDPDPEDIEGSSPYGCVESRLNPGTSVLGQQPGLHIMNGTLTEEDITDGEVIIEGGNIRLVLS